MPTLAAKISQFHTMFGSITIRETEQASPSRSPVSHRCGSATSKKVQNLTTYGIALITLQDSVRLETIHRGAFKCCYKLRHVTIPSSVYFLEDAFEESTLESIVITHHPQCEGSLFSFCPNMWVRCLHPQRLHGRNSYTYNAYEEQVDWKNGFHLLHPSCRNSGPIGTFQIRNWKSSCA